MASALRQLGVVSVLAFGSTFGASFAAGAKLKKLPPNLQRIQGQLEREHEQGINQFFKSLNESCDTIDILNNVYAPVKNAAGTPALFRVESRVFASCLQQDIWYCYSSFTKEGTYRYTNCETDGPLFEE